MKQRMVKLLLLVPGMLLFYCFSHAENIGEVVYGIYSDTYDGMKYGNLNPPDPDGGIMGIDNCALSGDGTTFYEGNTSLKAITWSQWGGFWIHFGSPTVIPTDMTAYSGGTIDFAIKTSTEASFTVKWIKANGNDGIYKKLINADFGVPLDDCWHFVSTSVASIRDYADGSAINLSSVTFPAIFYIEYVYEPPPNRTFWVDAVAWKTASAGSLSVAIKNISDDTETDQLTWSGVEPGSTKWKAADQYIELQSDYSMWGVQVYTDNKGAGANPEYTGSGDPCGLIDTENTAKRLPLCWRMVDVSTSTLTIRQTGDYHLYSNELGSGFYCWLFMQDRNTSGFVNGSDAATIWNNRGIHYAEGDWGSAASPNYLYIGADFSTALTPKTYRTNKLIVELYHE